MSRSKVRLTLNDSDIQKLVDLYPDVSISYIITELLDCFLMSVDSEPGSVEEILSRFR
jgi:citrate lyase synthetase